MTGRGKRPDLPGGRPLRFDLRLSQHEYEQLAKPAGEQGVSIARYLVEVALYGVLPCDRQAMRADVRDIRTQVIGIARNVNQAMPKVHATGQAQALLRLAGTVEELRAQVDAVARGMR